MQPESKSGPKERICLMAAGSRVRPEELMRRKLMQKLIARRERRLALAAAVRRAV
jgi:hypothetical protein